MIRGHNGEQQRADGDTEREALVLEHPAAAGRP